eukprot:TRINITY_DN91992_c0_g1_i1.p1 TRINITY_DN91992_c0_g1~~TRINITY_DN91992_c0_g1_i1.p1  ORF type:complete len:394 (-),score=81.24 TRINITY_DN91992_c0_g1_i1:89-1270(-)
MAFPQCRCLITCLAAFFLHSGRGIDLSWTQYSDRASLPQSQHAREDLRASLDRIDTDKLEVSDMLRVQDLKRLLDEVISETRREALANDDTFGILRLAGPPALVKEYLTMKNLALLGVLLALGATVLGPIRDGAAAMFASQTANRILEAERGKNKGNKTAPLAKVPGAVFPDEVAEALCGRITAIIASKGSKRQAKDAKLKTPIMGTQELGQHLAEHFPLPEVEVADRALRRDKKKLRQATQAAEKAIEAAKEAARASAVKVVELEKLVCRAEDAKKVADAKKGPKNQRKTADVEDARKFAEDARIAASAKAAAVEVAMQTAQDAKEAEDRPPLLGTLEGAWLHAVTQAFVAFAAKQGTPTPAHMHAWARNESVRCNCETAYAGIVIQEGFLR